MEALRKTGFSLFTENEGGVRVIIHAQGPEQEQRGAGGDVAKVVQVVQREEWRREAVERIRMEQEDSNSPRRRAWEKMWRPWILVPSMFLALNNCSQTSDWTSSSRHLSPQWRQPSFMLRTSCSNWVSTNSPISVCRCVHIATLGDARVQRRMFVIICRFH